MTRTTLPNPPAADSFDELRERLDKERAEQDDEIRTYIGYVEDNGRREDIAITLTALAGRVSAIQEYFIATMTDEQLAEILPEWHELADEDEEGES